MLIQEAKDTKAGWFPEDKIIAWLVSSSQEISTAGSAVTANDLGPDLLRLEAHPRPKDPAPRYQDVEHLLDQSLSLFQLEGTSHKAYIPWYDPPFSLRTT